jgi:hypothetical protein
MPKLSQNSLEKRFVCQTCGRSFRTRQGLSGHMQFRHSPGAKSQHVDIIKDSSIKLLAWQTYVRAAGFPPQAAVAGERLIDRWTLLSDYLDSVGIKVNGVDFKYFMLDHFEY